MVDEAHATGASGRADGARSPPPASAARSTWSSAPSARRSAPTAPTPARAPRRSTSWSTAPALRLLDRAAAALGRRRDWRRWSARIRAGTGRAPAGKRDGVAGCACRRGARRGPARGPRSCPIEVGDAEPAMELCERLLERGVFAQGIRPPTVPEGSSRLRFTVMASHRKPASWRAPRSWSAPPPASSACSRPKPSPLDAMPVTEPGGVFVTGTGTEVGKTVVAAVIAHTLAAQGRRVAVFKPAVTGLDEAGGSSRDHELLRLAAGSARATRRSRPTGTRLPPRPIWPRRWPARRSIRRGCWRRRGLRPAGADALVCEGVGGLLVPLAGRRLSACATWRSTSACPLVIAASPGLGTINHTLLTIEAARAAGLEIAAVVLTPWPERPEPDRAVKSGDDRLARRGRGPDPRPLDLGSLDLARQLLSRLESSPIGSPVASPAPGSSRDFS